MLSYIKKALGFPGGAVVKNLPTGAEDADSIPELRRSPGVGNGNPFPYSCLEKFRGQRILAGLQCMGSQRVGHG